MAELLPRIIVHAAHAVTGHPIDEFGAFVPSGCDVSRCGVCHVAWLCEMTGVRASSAPHFLFVVCFEQQSAL